MDNTLPGVHVQLPAPIIKVQPTHLGTDLYLMQNGLRLQRLGIDWYNPMITVFLEKAGLEVQSIPHL